MIGLSGPWRVGLILALPSLLLLAGFGFLGQSVWMKAKAELAQVLMMRSWAQAQAGQRGSKPWPWADFQVAGKLSLPRLGEEVLILDDASDRSLAFGPGLVGGPLNLRGHSVIAAHRDSHFAALKFVRAGDVIEVENSQGDTRRFSVRDMSIADSRTDALVLEDRSDGLLTLVTCYPFNAVDPGGPLRYVVTATAL